MTTIPLYTVSFAGARGVHVELFADEQTARARRDEITADGAQRVVLASHEMRVGR